MTQIESGDTVAMRWSKIGYSFGVWEDPPGHVSADLVHEADEILYVVSGRMLIEMEGKKIELAAGDEAVIPAQIRHTVSNAGTAKSRWFYGYKRMGHQD